MTKSSHESELWLLRSADEWLRRSAWASRLQAFYPSVSDHTCPDDPECVKWGSWRIVWTSYAQLLIQHRIVVGHRRNCLGFEDLHRKPPMNIDVWRPCFIGRSSGLIGFFNFRWWSLSCGIFRFWRLYGSLNDGLFFLFKWDQEIRIVLIDFKVWNIFYGLKCHNQYNLSPYIFNQ